MDIEHAIACALHAHFGQKDKAGEVYVLHPLRVMFAVRALGGTEEEQIAAVLHDVVEDTPITIGQLSDSFGFSGKVCGLVEALTRRRSEAYDAYIDRVLFSGHSAILIKVADLRDNLQRIPALRAIAPGDAARLENKYLRGLAFLGHHLN